jgi:hypothetical protein
MARRASVALTEVSKSRIQGLNAHSHCQPFAVENRVTIRTLSITDDCNARALTPLRQEPPCLQQRPLYRAFPAWRWRGRNDVLDVAAQHRVDPRLIPRTRGAETLHHVAVQTRCLAQRAMALAAFPVCPRTWSVPVVGLAGCHLRRGALPNLLMQPTNKAPHIQSARSVNVARLRRRKGAARSARDRGERRPAGICQGAATISRAT